MTSIVVNGNTPFGALSNALVNDLDAAGAKIARLQAAAAAAASGYGGAAGTEFETGTNFGVVPSATPGAKGADWQFALGTINSAWATFLSSAAGAITALDNG